MATPKKKLTAAQKRAKKAAKVKRQKKYMWVFMNGKQVRVKRPDTIDGLVQQFGCYILEVGRRQYGGVYQWYERGNQPVLVVDDGICHVALMTWDRVRSRLGGDAGDSIPFFYDGFASRARKNEPGTRSTIV